MLKVIKDNDNCALFKQYKNDVGLDLKANISDRVSISQLTTIKIPTGVKLKPPQGTFAMCVPRSGLASKGISAEIGIVDPDYTGELMVSMTNNSIDPYIINPYDRIAQVIFIPYQCVSLEDIEYVDSVEELNDTADRGDAGFGSTDVSNEKPKAPRKSKAKTTKST